MSNKPKKEQNTVREIIKDSIISNPEQTIDDLINTVNSEIGNRPSRATVLLILAQLGKKAKRLTRWEDDE